MQRLKASGAYPDELGETIVAAWHGSRLAPGVTESKPPSGDADEEGAQRMRLRRRVPKPPGVTESNPWQHASSEDEEGAQTASSKPKEAAASTQTQSWCQCHSEDETDTKKTKKRSWHNKKKTPRMRAIRSTVPRLCPSSEGDFHGNSAAARMRIPSLLLPNQEQEVSCRPGVPRRMLGNAAAVRVSNGVTWALLRNAVLHGGNRALDK